MSPEKSSHNTISGQELKLSFTGLNSAQMSGADVQNLIEKDRKASRAFIDQLHPANRLRLMFGYPVLPEKEDG